MVENQPRRAGFASIDGAQMYYEVVGSGPAVVFVHAGIADNRMWDDQVAAFARRFQVVRYDLRGYGQTAPVAGEYMHHEELRALLDHLGIARAALVGCSKGGGMCIDFALAYPERVTALVTVGSAPQGYEFSAEQPAFWDEAVAAWKAGDLERTAEYEVRLWVDGLSRTPDQVDAAIRDKVREMDLIALRNEQLGLGAELRLEPAAIGRLSEIQAPTLAIVGDLDEPDLVAAADFMASAIPGAQRYVMHGAAHLPNMERPEEFNRVVLAFLLSQG